MSSDFDDGGGWKQQTYPWSSNAPASADDYDGRPARSHFWVIPALVVVLLVVFVLLAAFAPEDPPPLDGVRPLAERPPAAVVGP